MSDIIKTQRSLAIKAKFQKEHQLKEKIKAIRGAKCECCGALGKLDLHHITPRKNKGKDTEDNLQLLCRPCHAQTPSFGRR